MKKFLTLLLAIVITVSLTACEKGKENNRNKNSSTNTIEGTWTVDWIESDGVKFTIDEWEKYEYEDLSMFYIIFKEGGQAFIYEDEDWGGSFVDWSKTDAGIIIDGELAVFNDERICYSNYGDLLYLKKTSDNQVVPENDLENDDEESEDIEYNSNSDNEDSSPDSSVVSSEETETDNALDSDFKLAMDEYEEFMNDYVDFMKKYNENPTDLSLLSEYANFISDYADYVESFGDWEDEDLNSAELAYYIDVQTRVNKKLLEVTQ